MAVAIESNPASPTTTIIVGARRIVDVRIRPSPTFVDFENAGSTVAAFNSCEMGMNKPAHVARCHGCVIARLQKTAWLMRCEWRYFLGIPPYLIDGTTDFAMIEILFIYQLARNPLQAMARRWWCRSLFRATAGKGRCRECGES